MALGRGPSDPASRRTPVLSQEVATRPERCRCGTRIASGSPCWGVRDPPEPIEVLLSDVRFCSEVCVRASLLESLELFAGSAAAAVVTDVAKVLDAFRSVYDLVATPFGVVGAQNDAMPARPSAAAVYDRSAETRRG